MSRTGTNTSSPGTMGSLGAFAGLNGMLMNAVEGGNFKTGLTPAGGIGTPGPEGVSPLPSHSGAANGQGTSVNGSMIRQQVRDQEEERRLRLESIVRLLGERWGYVSREGVERCARRVGLECLWEDEVPGSEGRTLSIAGNLVFVDVMFLRGRDEVGSLTLGFPEREEGEWGKSAEKGAKALNRDLKGGTEDVSGYVSLKLFVENLQRLGALDRLGTGGVNCFDAVEGVGEALRKVWEIEMKRRRQDKETVEQEKLELEVMCKGSGKPTMHAGGRLGLALLFWMDRRLCAGRKRKADEMDIDDAAKDTATEKPSTWSINIECQPSSADLYPSIRVSNNWVSEASEKPPAGQQEPFPSTKNDTSHINWQDPLPTFTSSEQSAPNAMDLDTNALLQQKPPDVRFVARVYPPVLVPLQTAVDIFNSVGLQETLQPTTYDSLLLPNGDGSPSPSATERAVERIIHAPGKEDSSVEIKRHRYTLLTDAQPYARNIEEIPFSHPRQIVALLPVLRQWAFVASILRRCLQTSTNQDVGVGVMPNGGGALRWDSDSPDSDADPDDDEHSSIHPRSSPRSGLQKIEPTAIDIALSLSSSSPRISIIFPFKGELASIMFSVALNAEIKDVELTVCSTSDAEAMTEDGTEKGEEMAARKEKIRKVLELSEDIGLLVEWIQKSK